MIIETIIFKGDKVVSGVESGEQSRIQSKAALDSSCLTTLAYKQFHFNFNVEKLMFMNLSDSLVVSVSFDGKTLVGKINPNEMISFKSFGTRSVYLKVVSCNGEPVEPVEPVESSTKVMPLVHKLRMMAE